MNVLVLSLTSPLPADNGVKMRTLAMMRALVSEGCELTLLAFTDARRELHPDPLLRQLCSHVELIPRELGSLSLSRQFWARLRRLSSKAPFGVLGCRYEHMRQAITRIVADRNIDVILCEQSDPLINLPSDVEVPVIIDHHNAEHLILQRYAALERNPAKKLYAWLESRKIRAWEQKACERAAVALACSARDLDVLRSLAPQTQFFVVPNVVDVNHYRPDPGREQPHTIVFQGGMDWYPNRDAVQFFIAEILPQVRSSFSDVKFIVAGRNPPEAFRRQCEATAGVVFTGTVDDMRSVIARAAISVVPLRIGSGTRLKILEAAAMGKAIVSTSLGAEGLDFRSSDDILIADRAPDFAAAVTTLLADAVARRRIGLAARQRVEELYSSAALRAAIRPALELVGSDRLVPA